MILCHSIAVWIRFPGLPIEYYDEKLLMAMGNTIGKALKVDSNTSYAARGKFARVCIELVWMDNSSMLNIRV